MLITRNHYDHMVVIILELSTHSATRLHFAYIYEDRIQ